MGRRCGHDRSPFARHVHSVRARRASDEIRKRRHGRMRYAVIERIARSRTASVTAILAVLVSIILSGSLAQGRVVSLDSSRLSTDLSGDTIAKVTGGGTVLAAPLYPNTVATFGVNARRPPG